MVNGAQPATSTAFRPGGIVQPAVGEYLRTLQGEPDALLREIHEHGRRDDVPIVSDDTGALLDVLIRLHDPGHVVEFGTAIGYSTVFMARAMRAGSVLTSFEIDPGRHAVAGEYIRRAAPECTVRLQLGDALELMRLVEEPVDFAFLDATKGEYRQYLDMVLERMPTGGCIVVDNALMSGTVATGESDGHWTQESIDAQRSFNEQLVGDERMRATVLPVGDGVGLAVRV